MLSEQDLDLKALQVSAAFVELSTANILDSGWTTCITSRCPPQPLTGSSYWIQTLAALLTCDDCRKLPGGRQ